MPVADTVRGFKEILDGKHDEVPEANFYMKGGIEEIHDSAPAEKTGVRKQADKPKPEESAQTAAKPKGNGK